jgi:hypothetical protein
MTGRAHPSGRYIYAPGIEPYSGGVRATAGYEVQHVTLTNSREWREGFAVVERFLGERELDRDALCAVELRCPQPHSFDGFIEFNHEYRSLLNSWELLVGEDNPVARTNVAPVAGAPAETHMHAFSVVVPSALDRPTFVIAGAGDLVDQSDLRPEAIVRAEPGGEQWGARIDQVMTEMETRMSALGVGWDLVTDIDVYCAEAGWAVSATEAVGQRAGTAAANGLTWFVAHPPILGLSYEMDVRSVVSELRI